MYLLFRQYNSYIGQLLIFYTENLKYTIRVQYKSN